jgi:hypothetical protein
MREACNHARIYPCGRLPHAAPHVGIVGRDGPARLSPVIAGFLERRKGGSPVKCEVHFARVADRRSGFGGFISDPPSGPQKVPPHRPHVTCGRGGGRRNAFESGGACCRK